jgi:hypothetical protein
MATPEEIKAERIARLARMECSGERMLARIEHMATGWSDPQIVGLMGLAWSRISRDIRFCGMLAEKLEGDGLRQADPDRLPAPANDSAEGDAPRVAAQPDSDRPEREREVERERFPALEAPEAERSTLSDPDRLDRVEQNLSDADALCDAAESILPNRYARPNLKRAVRDSRAARPRPTAGQPFRRDTS